MTIAINYKKRKNTNLFNKMQTNQRLLIDHIQNYIPIYNSFFSLNDTNFNSINLNNELFLLDINNKTKNTNSDNVIEQIFSATIQNNSDTEMSHKQNIFIKIAPLLDPCKYLTGKYDHTDETLFNLPNRDKSINIHPKILNPNNSSYVDGFFSYLSSKTLHEYNFIHGIDYFGSFLGIKNNYKINVIDDIDYLAQSDFFNKNADVMFKIDNYEQFVDNYDIKQTLKPLIIDHESNHNIVFDDIYTTDGTISLNDMKTMNIDLIDITNTEFNIDNIELTQNDSKSLKTKSTTSCSSGTCSSRTSHTNENDDCSSTNDSSNDSSNDSNSTWISDDSSSIEETTLYATIPKFPVQLICTEQCENTLDYLIINELLSNDEFFSSLMQIIMILITYQHMFSFTHNDLHTNNIMYINTTKKYIYYLYNKTYYKVPTYGRIFKIIDFGRAIYKFKGQICCSDSFQIGGDAATQYNTEPFFNENKPRLEPNFSFDLCRLACSIFDYVIDELDDIKTEEGLSNPIIQLINAWCIDDNGINVLYKTNGNERYPDFKLYKMIARCVHNHTPQSQLDRPEFSKFVIPNSPKGEQIFNIDILPSYI